MRYTAEQLYEHEMFHSIVARNKGMWGDIVRHLFETRSQEEIRSMVDAYASAYAGCYDNEADAVELYLEEILADVYAEMQRGSSQQGAARELAGETAQRFAGDIENARQNRAGIDNRNGPGTRLSNDDKQQDQDITISSGPSARIQKGSKKPVAKVLADSIDKLQDISPLTHLTGREMNDRSKTLPSQVAEFFASFGNKVHREGFGDVLFNEYGVGGFLNHKPLNREKCITLVATPEIVKYGAQISYEENHEGKGYQSYIFAGPVTVGDNNTKIYVAAVVDVRPDNKFYLNECVDSEGNYVRISEGPPSNSKPGVTVQDGVTKRPGEPSIDNIAQSSEESKTSEEKNPDAVDWVGNLEQRRSPSENAGDISGKDAVYMQAVEEGRMDEVEWMNDEAARQAGFNHKGFHQTGADFTSFNTDNEVAGQFDDETPTGIFIKPTDEDIGLQSGTKQMPLYFKADNMLEFANREEIREYWKKNVPGYRELDAQLKAQDKEMERQYDELDAEWNRIYQETYDSDDQSALDDVDRRQDEFLEKWNKELQPLRRQMKNLVTEYMKGTDYDGIHLKYDGKVYGGPKVETYIVFDPQQTKSAELVTRDNQGKVIPLSERFRTDRTGTEEWKNRDIRFSAADEEDVGGVDWLDGSELEDETPPHPSPAATPAREDASSVGTADATAMKPSTVPRTVESPQGEGSGGQIARTTETEERIATTQEGPRKDNEGNGGQVARATGLAGGQIARATETEERIATTPEGSRKDNEGKMAAAVSGRCEALAREKKVAGKTEPENKEVPKGPGQLCCVRSAISPRDPARQSSRVFA